MADKCTRWWFNNKKERVNQGRKEEAKSFSWFFSQREFFSPVENFHFGRPKTSFSGFEKWKAKKKKKKKKKRKKKKEKKRKKKNLLLIFLLIISLSNFSSFHFQFSIFPFTIFLLFFSIFLPFFLASFFPVGQQKFPGQKFLGGTMPPAPPVTPLLSNLQRTSKTNWKYVWMAQKLFENQWGRGCWRS